MASGSVAYNIVQITNDPKNGAFFEVKSRFKHKWKGKLNIVNYGRKIDKKEDRSYIMQKNFILTKEEFFQVFGCAYITSMSKSINHITDYFKILIPPLSKKAIYLKFTIKKVGFMDFSFIQSYKNKVPLQSSQSVIDHRKYN